MAKLVLLFAILSTVLITGYVSAKTVLKQRVRASCFGDTPNDRNRKLENNNYYYAELSKNPAQDPPDFSALNSLPRGHRLRITFGGTSIFATKGDVGRGKVGDTRKIDLHITAARAFGFSSCKDFGVKSVTIESA